MKLTVGSKTFTVLTEENETVRALSKLLPLTLEMEELNGNEKYRNLDRSLPAAPERVGSISAGDLMLYGDNCLVLFYESFETPYSYTRIGHLAHTDGLSDALGEGSVSVTLEADQSAAGGFDLQSGTVTLNSGYVMPILGLGTWTLDNRTAEQCVYEALSDGYRLIDTAQYYGNEAGVGKGIQRAIRDGIVTREQVFVTTKVMPSNYDRAYRSIDESLQKLGLEYIDLMLIHQSGRNDTQVYQALCQGVRDGKLHSIGISNYYTPEEFERVTADSEIKPAVVQNENHPYYQNTELQAYTAKYGTVIESWYPLGGRGHTQELFQDETIRELAAAHQKTPAQIILRWQLQAGFIAIPGSSNPEHIAENHAIFDFELTEEEMERMTALHTGNRYENW